MKKTAFLAMLALSSAVLAASVPHGWATHTDRKDVCQFATPVDWTADTLTHHMWSSPDNKDTIVVSGAPDMELADAKKVVESTFPPEKVIEENATKLWYAYRSVKPNTTNWYYGVEPKASLVCGAQLSFDPTAEPLMKQVVATISAK